MKNLCSFGATMASLNQEIVGLISLPALPLTKQDEIVEHLAAFDDLIENNRRRIEILEEMARLLYREWFVHFRFPGHEDAELVDSELGPIPEGWQVGGLVEICSLVMGQSPKSEFYNEEGEGLPFHQGVSDFGLRYPTHRKWTTIDKRVAEPGDILFSVRAPVGRINVAEDRLVVGRGLSAIRALDGRQEFMLLQLKDRFAVEDSIGGGTIFNAVTKKDMERIALITPSSEIVEQFEQLVVPMANLGQNLSKQNSVLREARDLLLPRLVSGELDMSELELGEVLS
jgi:type I restriction enzyme S subunit